jgi:enoyl-[acyl-carrier protein] reductase III
MAVLVTGGSKGIGLGVAERFAQEGHAVVLNYGHDDEAAAAAAAQVEDLGAVVRMVRADIATQSGVARLADVCASVSDDHPWHVVHAAVKPTRSDALELTAAQLHDAVDVNGLPLVTLARSLRHLLDEGSTITLISSEGPRVVVDGYAAVACSKAVGETLVRYLASELAGYGIRVNTVVAGPVLTDALRAVWPDAHRWFDRLAKRNPSGRAVIPAAVAGTVAFLAGPDAAMITGQTLLVDGGAGLRA